MYVGMYRGLRYNSPYKLLLSIIICFLNIMFQRRQFVLCLRITGTTYLFEYLNRNSLSVESYTV